MREPMTGRVGELKRAFMAAEAPGRNAAPQRGTGGEVNRSHTFTSGTRGRGLPRPPVQTGTQWRPTGGVASSGSRTVRPEPQGLHRNTPATSGQTPAGMVRRRSLDIVTASATSVPAETPSVHRWSPGARPGGSGKARAPDPVSPELEECFYENQLPPQATPLRAVTGTGSDTPESTPEECFYENQIPPQTARGAVGGTEPDASASPPDECLYENQTPPDDIPVASVGTGSSAWYVSSESRRQKLSRPSPPVPDAAPAYLEMTPNRQPDGVASGGLRLQPPTPPAYLDMTPKLPPGGLPSRSANLQQPPAHGERPLPAPRPAGLGKTPTTSGRAPSTVSSSTGRAKVTGDLPGEKPVETGRGGSTTQKVRREVGTSGNSYDRKVKVDLLGKPAAPLKPVDPSLPRLQPVTSDQREIAVSVDIRAPLPPTTAVPSRLADRPLPRVPQLSGGQKKLSVPDFPAPAPPTIAVHEPEQLEENPYEIPDGVAPAPPSPSGSDRPPLPLPAEVGALSVLTLHKRSGLVWGSTGSLPAVVESSVGDSADSGHQGYTCQSDPGQESHPPLTCPSQPWFLTVDRAGAADLLQGRQNGSFLVRPTRTGGQSPMAISFVTSGRTFHLPIRRRVDGKLALGTPKPGEKSFVSVEKMVEYYQREPLEVQGGQSVVLLKQPSGLV